MIHKEKRCKTSQQIEEIIIKSYFLVRQRIHVANDLGGHLASLRRSALERPLYYRYDESKGGSVDEVHKLSLQEVLKAARCLLGRVLHRSQ